MAFKKAIANAQEEYKKKKKEEEELKNKLVYKTANSVVPITPRNKDANDVSFTSALLGGISNFTGAGSLADKTIMDLRNDKDFMEKAKAQGLDTSQLYTTQENLNMFGADVKRAAEATGAGISSTLSNLGKGALLVGRDLGVASDFSDKIVNEARNLDTKELEDLAKKANVSTQTLKDYISKTKTSYENINDFSANTFDKWANEANQRVQELQAETDNPFTKEVIGFMPNLSQQAVNVGVSFINPALVPYVAGLEAKGSYYNDAKQRGMTDEQANDFSTAMAGVEAFTEKLTVKDVKAGITKIGEVKSLLKGGIKGATKEATQEAVKETTKSGIKEAFKSLAKGMGENAFQEGVTEIIQEAFADAITKKDLGQSFYDFLNQQDNWEDIWGRVFKSAVGGALSAGITGGVGMGVSSCVSVNNKIQNGEQVTQQEILQANQDAIEKSKTLPKEQQEQFNGQITQGSEIGIQNVINQVETEQNQPQNEQKSAVPMQTSENAQQQVQEQEQQVISNQNENALKENVEPQNLVESAERSGIDVKDEKTRKNLEVIQKFNENRGVKATFDAEPFKGHDNVNSFFRVDENGNREIVYNPNTKTQKTLEQLAVHEVYHDMVAGGTAQELTDFAVQKMSNNPEYQEYVRALQDVYGEQDSDIIKEEAVAHYLEKNLGTNEFISELQERGDRTTIQRIIDTIKDMITKAKNTLTGKGDLNYLLDLQRKYEQAYRGEFKGTQEQTKLSKQVSTQDNQGKTLTEEQPINKITDDNKLKMTYVRMNNQDTQNYGDTYGQNIEPSGEYMSMDTMQGKYKVPGAEYGTITFENPLVLEHKNTTANGWKKDLSERYNNLTGKKLSNAIMKDGYDAIVTQDEKGNVIEVVNLNGNKETNNNNTKYSVNTSNQPTTDNQGRTLTKEQQDYFKDSKVRDENGNLLEVYHGTKTNGINVFKYSPKNQTGTDYGKAFYFTSDYTKAQGYQYDIENDPAYKEYSKKDEEYKNWVFEKDISEEERSKRIKEWSNWHEKNSVFDILNNENFTPERLPKGETKKVYLNLTNPYIADAKGEYYFNVYDKYFKEAKENGNDGIIVKNVIDVARGEHKPIDVYIAFNENQIKNVDNTNPTESPDIRYSKEAPTRDNQGRTLTKEQSKIKDEKGNLLNVYHTTNADFDTFDKSKIGSTTDDGIWGKGFYFSNKPADYGSNKITANLYISNPFVINDFKTPSEMADFLDMSESNFYKDNGIGAIRPSYSQINQFTAHLIERGYDGVVVKHDNGFTEYVAFNPEQINIVNKENTNATKDNNKDNQGRELSKKQQEYFKNSKARDKDGNLLELYHTSPSEFTIFDKSLLGKNTGYGNTAFGFFVTPNREFSQRFGDIDNQGNKSNTMSLYANVEKPITYPYNAHYKYDTSQLDSIVREYMSAIGEQEALQELESYAEENESTIYDEFMGMHVTEDMFDYAEENRKTLEKNGYDAVEFVEGTENMVIDNSKNTEPVVSYAVFNSNQLKNIDNVNPTDNPDINLSKQGQGKSQQTINNFLENTKVNEGTGTAIKDLARVPIQQETQVKTKTKEAPVPQETTQDYLTHHPDYYDGDQFDFNAHRTEVINKANQDIVDIIKNSSNLREDLQRAYDLNEKNDVVDIKTGQDEDNRLTYQHKETILSSLLRSKDIENSDLYKLLMEDNTPRQVAPSEAPAQVPQVNEVKQRQVESTQPTTQQTEPVVGGEKGQRKTLGKEAQNQNLPQEFRDVADKLYKTNLYTKKKNSQLKTQAQDRISKVGADNLLTDLTEKTNNSPRLSAEDMVASIELYNHYVQKGDIQKSETALQNLAMSGTEIAQALQAMSIMNHMTPQGQAIWIQRSADKLNKSMLAKKKATIQTIDGQQRIIDKNGKDITDKTPLFKFTQEMQQKLLNSTKDNMYDVIDDIYKEMGQQVPKTHMEQFDEWRFFSMLGNPKTHIRNSTGNVTMEGLRQFKNKLAGAIEDAYYSVTGKDGERNHTLRFADKKTKEFAKQDVKNRDVQTMLGVTEDKYNPQSRLKQNQRTFKSNLLENSVGKLFKGNTGLLSKEDVNLFGIAGLEPAYQRSLAEYITANRLDVDTMTDKQLAKAREYAVTEAKEATFHTYNKIASMLNTLENKNLATKILVGGTVPFKQTPMNVAIQGFEYSPAGLLKTLAYDTVQLKNGNINANQYINKISKGLTGTGIALLGYALTSAGVLKASSGGDDKDDYEKSLGKQNYAIQIGDNTYSLDWLAPAGIPLFVGSELYQISKADAEEKKGGNVNQNEIAQSAENLFNAMTTAMNPMTEMTMLSGLTSVLKSYANDPAQALGNIVINTGKSYVTQSVPTALGQIARSTDDKERSTSSTESNVFTKAIDSTKNQIMSKVPGLRQMLPVATDVWGNEVEGKNYLENAILPANRKEVKSDKVDEAITKLYDETGESAVIPDTYIQKTLTLDKEKYRLTNEEYAQLKQQYGQSSHDLLEALTQSSDYDKLTNEQKVKAVKEVYSYVKASLKHTYADQNDIDVEDSKVYQKVQDVIRNGGDAKDYFKYVGLTNGMDKDAEKINALENSNIRNKGAIYESTIGKDDDNYKIMKNTGVNDKAYLDYKQQKFTADKDAYGKTISGSAKDKFYDYMDNANMTYEQKLLLTGMNYTLLPGERDTLANYIESLPISASEKTDIYRHLKGAKVYNNGEIYY